MAPGVVTTLALALAFGATTQLRTTPPQTPTRANLLRGEYGRYRANNDLVFYHLDVRVDPEKKLLSGKNTIKFRMLQDDTRIQLDLYENLTIEKIMLRRIRALVFLASTTCRIATSRSASAQAISRISRSISAACSGVMS